MRSPAAHEWPLWRALRLCALADSPDAYASTLASEQQRSPDIWASRLAAALSSGRDRPLIVEADGDAGRTPIGMLWAKAEGEDELTVCLYQVWVAPEGRGRGAGARLVDSAIAWARQLNAKSVVLSVTSGDTPAFRLYRRAGFVPDGAATERRAGEPLMEQAMRLDLMTAAAQA